MERKFYKKCINFDTLQAYYKRMTIIDQLYIDGLEDKKHVVEYKVFKNCVILTYASGYKFKQFFETQTIKNLIGDTEKNETK